MTHKEFLKQVGLEIRVARIRKGLSANAVGEMTGLTGQTIWYIERGMKDTKILSYKRIADALQIDMKDFL
jgi:transcriptional regulator with XRE-family HTH domain